MTPRIKGLKTRRTLKRQPETPLCHAVERCDVIAVRKALADSADPNEASPKSGWPPLDLAAMRACTTIVKVLIRRGALVNARDELEFTPLMWASAYGAVDTAAALIRAGANVNYRARSGGHTALEQACGAGDLFSAFLTKFPTNPTRRKRPHADAEALRHNVKWRRSLEGDYKATVKMLLRQGAKPHVRDRERRTPLMWAAWTGNAEIVQLLLKAGARPFQRDRHGRNAFHCAVCHRDRAVISAVFSLLVRRATRSRSGRRRVSQFLRTWRSGLGTR